MSEPRIVMTADGEKHVFPAEATDAQISQALGMPPQGAAPKRGRTWTEAAIDTLPTVGGAMGGIIGGVGGTVAGMGVGGVPGAVGGAALGGATGESLKQLANHILGRQDAPTSSADAATSIGKEGGLQAMYELAGQGISKGLTGAGRALYRGFLKPSLSEQMLPRAKQIVETGLQEGLPISEGGAGKAQGIIDELGQQVDSILRSNPNARVDLPDIANKLRAWAKARYYRPGVPMADYNTALSVADAIEKHPSLELPSGARITRVNPSAAQSIKQGLGDAAGSKSFGLEKGAEAEAQKAGYGLMRGAVETAAPGVGPLNARASRLIDTANAIARASGREGNRNALFGMPALMSGFEGLQSLAHDGDPIVAATKAAATRLGLSPAVASRAAIITYKLGQMMPGQVPADLIRAGIQAAQTWQGASERE